jgi:hypothetical protein
MVSRSFSFLLLLLLFWFHLLVSLSTSIFVSLNTDYCLPSKISFATD